jgi:hypothetical protein
MPLIDEIESGLLPTITRTDANGRTYQYSRGDKEKPVLSLLGKARLLPTPRASDGMKHKLRTHLPEDHNYRGRLEDLVAALAEAPGYLNPQFVEWLMGFPVGWSAPSEHSETP